MLNRRRSEWVGPRGRGTINQPVTDGSDISQPSSQSTIIQATIDQSETGGPEVNQSTNGQTTDQPITNQPASEQREFHNPSHENSRQFNEDVEGVICEACKIAKGGSRVVQCDGCDQWFHFSCVKFIAEEFGEDDPWFCTGCQDNQLSTNESNELDRQADRRNQAVNTLTQPATSHQQETTQDSTTQSMVRSFIQWRSSQAQPPRNSEARVIEQRNHAIKLQNETNPQRVSSVDESERTESLLRGRESQRQNVVTTRAQVHREPECMNPFSQATSSKALSTKSKNTVSSQGRARLEQQKLQAELELQTKLDEEMIALKMEALKLKEDREKRFLEEKFKAMDEEDGCSSDSGSRISKSSKHSQSPKRQNNTEIALAWIEDQRRRKSQMIQSAPNVSIDVSHREIREIIEKQLEREASEFVNGRQAAQLVVNPSLVNDERPTGNHRTEDRLYNQSQPNTITQPEYDLPKCRDRVAPQPSSPNVRVNSTLIHNNQLPTPTYDQQHYLIPPSSHRNNVAIRGKSNDNHQSGMGVNQGTVSPSVSRPYQNTQLYQQQNTPVSQSHQNLDPLNQLNYVPVVTHSQPKFTNQQNSRNPPNSQTQPNTSPPYQQNQNFMNPYMIPSQQNVTSCAGPQNSAPQVQRSQSYQMSHYHPSQATPMSSQFVQGSSFSHQQIPQAQMYSQQPVNTSSVGAGVPVHSQSLSSHPESQKPPLTTNQIAARHVVKRRLPDFYGNPGDWPEFIQKFNSTTEACGFNNVENLDRLSECLKEPARGIVRSQLLMPDCVPSIIETLEQKYGRKDIVVKAVLEDIRTEPQIKADKLEALSNYGYKVQNVCHTIQRQQMDFYLYNPELVQELVDKLPYQTKIDWARYSDNMPQVTLATLSDWLIKLSRSLNRITMPEISTYSKNQKNDKKSENSIDSKRDSSWFNKKSESSKGTYLNTHGDESPTNANQSNRQKCEYCSKGCKSLADCSKFKGISTDERWKFLYGHKKICRTCLRTHKMRCTETKECGVNGCSYKHHPMLHDNEKMLKTKKSNQSSAQLSVQTFDESSSGSENTSESQPDPSCNTHRGGQTVLYKIIPVTLKNRNKIISTFAYLDEGSGLTLVESDLVKELELGGTPQKLCLRWTSGTVRHENESMRVVIEISGEGENQHFYQMRDVRTVKSLDLPKQNINKSELIKNYPYLERVQFQDFDAAPRILIGLDNVKLGLSREFVEGRWNEPIASKTLLGWVVHGQNGPVSVVESQHMQHLLLNVKQCECQKERDDELHQQIEEFFSLENFGVRALTNPVVSKEIQRATHIMETTTIRNNDRFETGLLWKFDNVKLPNNFSMAMKRLECQDRRMQSNPELMTNINNQIRNFLVKGYARKLQPDEIDVKDQRIWYLPVFHHLDPKKPEKVRLVWDAAAKFKGISLNSMLMTGPDNLVALTDILRRFRERCIAIGGDLEEMFHQVKVKKQDRNSQRFLWRNGKMDAKPDVYTMDVLTFGTNCSPSLAQNVKNKNASEFENEYPEAAKAIKENHYVDDWLDSQHTIEDTIRLAKQVKYVHRQGGFNLRKFISNSEEVLKAMGDDNSQQTKDLNVNTAPSTQKVLGMWWDAKTDCFTYSLKYTKLNEEVLLGLRAPTKREVLKTLMSIYDPLGLIAFFLVQLKMLLQEVWKAKVVWDQQLPDELAQKWDKWKKILPSVEKLHIPRLYSCKMSPAAAQSIELHTFVDAGENAYCATGYLRIIDQEGVDCVLVGAKTKVSPIKPLLTTPRLELLAAVLGTRLAKSIEGSLTIKIHKQYFWSDSRDVLCWIRSTTRKYRQFVAFRVGEILEATNENEWRWVPGNLNVADDATKWKTPNFDPNCRWFRGPDFLYGDENVWPQNLFKNETTEEEIHIHLVHTKLNPPSQIIPERFSNWSRLINAQALSTRFIEKLIARVKGQSIVGPLKADELRRAERTLYKLAQFDCYYDEITTLKNPKQEFGPKSYVEKSSSIYKCSPYMGEDGLLRVRGRIDKIGGVKFETKRPIILPEKHQVTKLVVNNYHQIYLHRNNETVINELKQRFFIPKLRVVLKKIISKCQTCKNSRVKPVVPEMGDLPVARLSPGFRIFSYTGVDYFGPINVVVKRGTEKRWGVLFTCLTVRAIHIEIATSLTADSCILCVRNFINTRGTPIGFYSDNGTNMKAADKELKAEFDKLDKEKIQSHYTRTYTSWTFNPPAAPHFGGAWERLIGTVKENLRMVMFTRTPKEELLRSYLLEIVNIVNSRPLTYVPIDSAEGEALTPNHFIFGASNGIKAPGDFPFEEKSLTKSWRRSQELTNMFWRRWIKEYLPTLTCRSKWFPKANPVKIGDAVLLVDELNARNDYPKGIVMDVIPDKYGQVRQATVRVAEVVPDVHGRTKDQPVRFSIKTRPIAKLAVLEIAGENKAKLEVPGFDYKPVVVDVANKKTEVKPVGNEATKCLNGEENVNNGNTGPIPKNNTANQYNPATGRRSSDRLRQRRVNTKSERANN